MSGLCLANEFGSTVTPNSIIYIQGLYNEQSFFQQPSSSCQAYKHRNNIYFGENLHNYTITQLQHYFRTHNYSEQQILDQGLLYLSDEFVKLAKTYAAYEQTIEKLYNKFKKFGFIKKILYRFTGSYSSGLKRRIRQLHEEIRLKKECEKKQAIETMQQYSIYSHYLLSDVSDREYQELKPVYDQFSPLLAQAIEKRIDAQTKIKKGSVQVSTKTYRCSDYMLQLLSDNKIGLDEFTNFYGNQLQHALHYESIGILEYVASLPMYSVLYVHQNAIVNCTTALSAYNKEGLVDKASVVADFCWTLLDYGQAIAEGAASGLYTTAQDLIANPIEATVCIVAGKQVLAYQLCKVFYNVTDIGITALNNYDRAKEKWDYYIEPINNLISAIEKKEITIRDALKTGTAFVVGYKAQSKLLGGLGQFFGTIKQSAIRFAQTNISSFTIQQYLSTPEGYLLRSTAKLCRSSNSPNQYEYLKQWLKIKEFTSVIKTSKHGIERLIERDFTPEEVLAVMKTPTFVKVQKDGAFAYIKQIGEKFNVIVFNKQNEEVVTVLKHTTQKKLEQMGKNYGW